MAPWLPGSLAIPGSYISVKLATSSFGCCSTLLVTQIRYIDYHSLLFLGNVSFELTNTLFILLQCRWLFLAFGISYIILLGIHPCPPSLEGINSFLLDLSPEWSCSHDTYMKTWREKASWFYKPIFPVCISSCLRTVPHVSCNFPFKF